MKSEGKERKERKNYIKMHNAYDDIICNKTKISRATKNH